MLKILMITDAWYPQVNGVVTTLSNLEKQATLNGDYMYVFHPNRCRVKFSLSFYPEIEIGIPIPLTIYKLLKNNNWDIIHIATPEGPIGSSFILMCYAMGINYTVSCHTKFPEFVNSKWKWFSVDFGWWLMKKLYSGANNILATTESMVQELRNHGFKQNIMPWTRGVDRSIFYPSEHKTNGQNVTLLCVSRVSVEKGLDDFCSLNMPNTKKVLVGDGPYLEILKLKYPDVNYVGKKTGKELGDYYRNATVFVFPSKNDTFGVVNIESLACGTPVAAYNVTGPKDIIENNINGFMSDNLEISVMNCLSLDRDLVYYSSKKWSWENCYQQFKDLYKL